MTSIRPSVRLSILTMLLVAAVIAAGGIFNAPLALATDDEIACNNDLTDPAGFACTELFNKGGGGTTVIGELFFK